MYLGLIVPAYGYAFFAPTILTGLGYSPIQTQLRSVPPWVCSFTLSMIIAWFSDKLRHRLAFTLIPICIALAGFGTLLNVHDNVGIQYMVSQVLTSTAISSLTISPGTLLHRYGLLLRHARHGLLV